MEAGRCPKHCPHCPHQRHHSKCDTKGCPCPAREPDGWPGPIDPTSVCNCIVVEKLGPRQPGDTPSSRLRMIFLWLRRYINIDLQTAFRVAKQAVEREFPRLTDITVTGRGSTLFSFHIVTVKARAWVEAHVDLESYQWLGENTFVVEHRYADDLMDGMRMNDLIVEES
jgi:hypothetical protein